MEDQIQKEELEYIQRNAKDINGRIEYLEDLLNITMGEKGLKTEQ